MGRGRKPISNFNGSEWETVFYNSVETYVQYINIQLSKVYKLEPLSNHLKIVGGYAFKTAEYKNQGIPIIRISDFNNEQIVLKDVVYYQETKELDKYQLIEGDIIIALTGGTIAKLAIVQARLGKIYLNQRVGKFQVLKPDEFEVEYIYWLARSIQSIIKNLAWGAAIPNVSPKQIEELKFPFPTKEIQRGIIDFLNDLKNNDLKDDKIYFDEIIENEIISLQEKQLTTSSISTELNHQLTLVKKLRQQLLQDAVQGKLVEQSAKDEPASELLKKIKIEKSKLKKGNLIEPVLNNEIPFSVPNNWRWCRFGEVVQMTRGKFSIRPRNDPSYFGGEYPFIQIGSLDEKGSVINEAPQTLNEKGIKVSKKFPKNTIAIAIVGGTIGNLGVLGREMYFTDSIIGIIPSSLYNQDFILSFLKYKQPEIKAEAYQMAGQPNIKIPTLENLKFPMPPLKEQIRIVEKLEHLMQTCNELEDSIKQSATQNEKLLQQVLREALRKPDGEAEKKVLNSNIITVADD